MTIDARYRRLLDALFALSGAALTFVLTLNYSVYIEYVSLTDPDPGYRMLPGLAVIAAVLSLPVYIWAAHRRSPAIRTLRRLDNRGLVCSGAMTVILTVRMMLDCQLNYDHLLKAMAPVIRGQWLENVGYKLFLGGMCLAGAFALFVAVAYTRGVLAKFLGDFIGEMDAFDRWYFLVVMVGFTSLIFFVFQRTQATWSSIDKVYQTDTLYMALRYYPTFSYGYNFDFDIGCGGIRHPLATLITYPIYVCCWFVANLLPFVPYIQQMLYAVVHVALMALTAIALRRITGSRWTTLLCTLGYPFAFYSVMVEKYAIAAFAAVMFAYATLRGRSRSEQKTFLIGAGGMMITSCFLGFYYGRGKNLKQRLKDYANVALTFLAALLCAGRLYYITGFGYLSSVNFTRFADVEWADVGIGQRFCGFSNLIASAFVPIDSKIITQYNGKVLYWTEALVGRVNWLGVALLAFAVLTAAFLWKNRAARLFAHWLLLAAIQELVLGIGIGADPLFCQYFGWAVLGLVALGVNALVKKPALRACVYAPALLAMVCLNVAHFVKLMNYMVMAMPA